MTAETENLRALGARLARDLEILEFPPRAWVPARFAPSGARVTDVVVIGAGMCGLAAAFALQREGINNIKILDAKPAGREGPWVSYARMETLRSPKHLAGPAMGLPNLAFRTWFEAKFGEPAWRDLGKIPRPMWMEYLTWYRQVLALPVENNASVLDISSTPHGFDLTVRQGGEERVLPARRIVLATGREGLARPRVPAALAGLVGPSVRHSSDDIDFTAMRGKVVAIVGFSASAVDNAAEALEAGARKVHLLVRAPDVSRINKMKHTNFPGFTAGFSMLPAKARLDLLSYVMRYRTAPPRDSVNRVFRHPNVEINLNAPLERVTQSADRLEISAGAYRFTANEIIYCTGFKIDTQAPGELGEFAPRIRTFRDSVPDDGEILPELLDFPDLGPAFEFQAKPGEVVPSLQAIHNFTFAATVSHGNVSGDIPCVSDGATRLAKGIAAAIFNEDFAHHLADLHAHEAPELFGDEIPHINAWKPPVPI
ncbi:MAG: NAD(P)/FAD-dependent oxidoreductase [Pseudomonadota bacterium]|nr:NAD(P)/FAD-dependent oxidoreductase [Pseudomonadota bacterium]